VRGYLKITELGKESVLGHPGWKLTRVGHPTDLAPWESTIYQGLMSNRDEVLLSDLHEDYWSALGQAQAELYGSAVERGWFATNPAKQRDRWGSLAWSMVVVGLLLTLAAGVFPVTGIVGVPMLILSVVMIPLSRKMSKRTAKGSELLRRVLGFRLYINTAEKDRQQFNEKEHLFATYLPFAIVFGCAGRWARVFGEVPTESVVGTWYHGAGAYPVTGLSNHIQGFSQTVAHCINVAPAAPPGPQGRSGFLSGGGFSGGFGGGFGGGGFAGGGGGGGGGGAW
jgi:uncharacterized membrane protein YgcG